MSALTDRTQATFNAIQGDTVSNPIGLSVLNGFASHDDFMHLHPEIDDGEGNMIPKPFADLTVDEKALLTLQAIKSFALKYRNLKAYADEEAAQAAAQQAINDAKSGAIISEL